MADKADGSTVTEPIANGGVTPEMRNEFQKVVMGILKDAMPRMIEQTIGKSLPTMLEKIAGEAQKPVETKQPDANGGDGEARLTLKAMQTQITELTQQLQKEREATQAERQRVIDSQMRGEVREALAGVLGADNPNLPLVFDSYFDARKRFVRGEDGQTFVQFKSDYGADPDLVPLKDGIKKLAESELKHLMPSKTGALPMAPGMRRGNPVPANGAGAPSQLDRWFSDQAAQAFRASADPTQK